MLRRHIPSWCPSISVRPKEASHPGSANGHTSWHAALLSGARVHTARPRIGQRPARSLVALVDLLEKECEDARRHAFHLGDLHLDLLVRFLLVRSVMRLEVKLLEDRFDLLLRALVGPLGVVLLKLLLLLLVTDAEGGVDQPAALVVADVSADLAYALRVAVAVKVVILDLEEMADVHADRLRLLVELRIAHAREAHAEGARQVEGVERGLIDHDV
mmetsp:Transcript_45147/g.118461  ORF Transcript_45147/g.118461 Transcript_45147/m.118461 type:complete len:216 (-) Transcript_45147:829-1476(-)